MDHFGYRRDSMPDGVTLIIAPRRAMMRLLLRQQRCSLAESMLERLGVARAREGGDGEIAVRRRLIQSHYHFKCRRVNAQPTGLGGYQPQNAASLGVRKLGTSNGASGATI